MKSLVKIGLTWGVLAMLVFQSCQEKEANDSSASGHVSNEPLIVETDEAIGEPDVKIDNTLPTENLTDGWFEDYYPNNQLQAEGLVVNGKRSGNWVSYHPNGNKQSESFYVNGELDGKTAVFYASGQVMYIGYYSAGKYDGQWLYFDQEGTLVKEMLYKKGELIQQTEKNEKPE